MGTPFAVMVANAFMFHHEKDIVEYYSQYLRLYKRFIDDIFVIWCGPKGTLLEFLDALNSKTDRIKLNYRISESSVSFLDLFLYKDTSSNVLQFSTFQKPLNKYLYVPFESFHPSSNKKAFIRGELIRCVRNSYVLPLIHFLKQGISSGSDYELGGIHSEFCFHCFVKNDTVAERNGFTRNLRISRSSLGRTIFFNTTFNCSHARIKSVISNILPELDCTGFYQKTVTLANLCK